MSKPYEGSLTIEYLDLLSAAEVAPLVDAIGTYWSSDSPWHEAGLYEVATVKRPTPPAAQGPFVDPAVVILYFISGAIAVGFLERIGAEGWQAFRTILHRLYTSGAERGQSRGSDALSIRTVVMDTPVFLQFPNAYNSRVMTEEELLHALAAAKRVVEADMGGLEPQLDFRGRPAYVVEWDLATGEWRVRRIMGPSGNFSHE